MVDVFNPFSLINALDDKKLRNYWASSGATSLLPKFVDDMEVKLKTSTRADCFNKPSRHPMSQGAAQNCSFTSLATSPSRITRWGLTSSVFPIWR